MGPIAASRIVVAGESQGVDERGAQHERQCRRSSTEWRVRNRHMQPKSPFAAPPAARTPDPHARTPPNAGSGGRRPCQCDDGCPTEDGLRPLSGLQELGVPRSVALEHLDHGAHHSFEGCAVQADEIAVRGRLDCREPGLVVEQRELAKVGPRLLVGGDVLALGVGLGRALDEKVHLVALVPLRDELRARGHRLLLEAVCDGGALVLRQVL
mmetsp:Transcript_26588/g.78238  ORF Transcript_26588/g.78238 Transcript_26588/m.78238 type:complete len:211 (+) Transcript_26588:390-1022(+)